MFLSQPLPVNNPTPINDITQRIRAWLQGALNFIITGCLFKRDFLIEQQIKFSENMQFGENILFSFTCICRSKNYILIPQVGYVYRQTRNVGLRESNPQTVNAVIDSLANGFKELNSIMQGISFFMNDPLSRDIVLQCFYNRMPRLPLEKLRAETNKLTPQKKLNYFVLNILDHCNLNCRGCDHFASIAKEKFVPYETIARDVKRFSELMDQEVNQIGIMGGEPLLHPELADIIKVTRKYFPHTNIKVDTNGILLLNQKEDFWKSCKDNDIVICNTKYPINLDFNKMQTTCKQKGVKFEFYGNTGEELKTLNKMVLDLEGKQDPKKSFSRCSQANDCNFLMEGKLYPCTMAPNVHIFNEQFGENLQLSKDDYLDIYDESITKEAVLNFLARPIPFCRYCDIESRSYGYPWGITNKKETEWVLTEREKYPNEEIRIRTPRNILKFEVHLTEHCNLNCKGCFHFSSIANEEYLSLDEYRCDCERLSQLSSGTASEIVLLGGEPLFHKQITEFFDVTRKNFPNAMIRLVTNGILLPKMDQKFWSSCKKNQILISPTKYPIKIDYDGIEQLAKKQNVAFEYFGGGAVEHTLSLMPIDDTGNQDKENNFYGCYRANGCITLKHGRLYTCIVPAHIHHYKKKFKVDLPDFTSDGIDIYKANSLEELMTFLTKPIEACKYCDRMHTVDGLKWRRGGGMKEEWMRLK